MRTAQILVLANLGSVALAAVELYGQCGGSNYSGDTDCASGACCTEFNEWYSQCVACSESVVGPTATTEEPVSETCVSDEDGDDCEDQDEDDSDGDDDETTRVGTSTLFGGGDDWQTSIVVVPTSESSSIDDDSQPESTTKKLQSTATAVPSSGNGSGSVPNAVTRTLPASSGSVSSSTAIPISGSFDGGMKLYDRSRRSSRSLNRPPY